MSANSGPGWKKYPEHRITTKPAGVRVRVKVNGEVIADTRDAIELHEPHVGHVVAPVVYYIPRKDVKMDRLVRTSHESYCPFKGQASYFSLANGPENAVWSYERRTTRCSRSGSCSPSIRTRSIRSTRRASRAARLSRLLGGSGAGFHWMKMPAAAFPISVKKYFGSRPAREPPRGLSLSVVPGPRNSLTRMRA